MTLKIRNPETENPPNVPKMGSKLGASTDRNYSIENVCSQIQPSTKSERLQSVNTLLAPLCINNDLCCTVEKRIRSSIEWGLTKEKNALLLHQVLPHVRVGPADRGGGVQVPAHRPGRHQPALHLRGPAARS